MDPKIYAGGGAQDSNLEPYNQVVKVGEGWVDLEPVPGCQMSIYFTGMFIYCKH